MRRRKSVKLKTSGNHTNKKSKNERFPSVKTLDEFKKLYLPKETEKTSTKELPPQEAGELFAQQSLTKIREVLSGDKAESPQTTQPGK